jgi:tetratricopeptide (TPR) repeat protein
MFNSREFSHYATVLLLALLITSTSACSSLLARAAQLRGSQEPANIQARFSGKGMRITAVHPDSLAEHAGLKPMDVIFRYGDFEVVDEASYFAAREAYQNIRNSRIPLAVWRDGKPVSIRVEPGRLGIESNEYSPVAYQFLSLMMQLDAQREVADISTRPEFKDGYTPPEKILAQAKQIIDQAEHESTLTPVQILVARIYMIFDEASPEDLKRQSEMLAQLIATQPASYVGTLGQARFFDKNHHRPAVECFKRYLEVNPNDVSIRLNMGIAYEQLGMFAEAEAAAGYIFDHELGLSDHGLSIAYNLKAMGVLSRGDYSKAIDYAEKAFELDQCHCNISLVMLAAAETGDLQKLGQAQRRFQQVLPEEFEQKQFQVAAAEALALARSNQRGRARELTQKWKDKDRVGGRLKAYWKIYPNGSDVWTNWNDLTRN